MSNGDRPKPISPEEVKMGRIRHMLEEIDFAVGHLNDEIRHRWKVKIPLLSDLRETLNDPAVLDAVIKRFAGRGWQVRERRRLWQLWLEFRPTEEREAE